MRKQIIALLTGAILMIGMVGFAQAVPTSVTPNLPCNVTDMLLNGQNSDACSGPTTGNPGAAEVNSLTGAFAGNPWSEIAKDDPPGGAAGSGSYGGINFMLSATVGNIGTWDLTWSGSALPANIDLVAVLKAGNLYSAYLFDNEFLAAAGTNNPNDLWKISFHNLNNMNYPDLSHLSLYGRDVVPQEPSNPVPEPGTMMLLGVGMFALAVFGKRRMNKVS